MTGFLGGVQLKAIHEIGLDFAVPSWAERSKEFERLGNAHPRIKGDGIRHIAETGFDGDFLLLRVEAKDTDGAGSGLQEIEQAFDGGGFAGAVAAEKAVATATLNGKVQAVDGL